MTLKRTIVSLILMVVVTATLAVPASSAVDHSDYGTVLNRHVQGGYFDYEAFMDNRNSRALLDSYLDQMSQVSVDELGEDEALAYWMNLYNAATLELIEEHYPVDSIRDIGGWLSGPWSISFVETQRGTLTLDHIEHQIIRPEFDEPRIHFALVCAARSCPPLRDEPFTGDRLDQQLEDQTEAFLESNKNKFTVKDNEVVMRLSMILSSDWYAVDFGGPSGVADFVAPYLSEQARELIRNDRYRIEHIEYNWSLNQTPGPYQGFTGSGE